MSTNNIKQQIGLKHLLIFAAAVSLITVSMTYVNAETVTNGTPENQVTGKLIVKEMKTKQPNPDHERLTELNGIVHSETASDEEKRIAGEEMNAIMESSPKTPKLSPEVQANLIQNINKVSDAISYSQINLPITRISIDKENASLLIGILNTEFDDRKISEYEQSIRSVVGNELDITIQPDTRFILTCSQTGDCNPIKGGVKIQVETDNNCSMGFKASYDGETGFVTAGHCNYDDIGGTGEDVGNPTDSAGDKIGTVYANGFGNHTFCDCLFVSNSTENVSDKTFPNVDVDGTLFPTDEDFVTMEGHVTQGETGQITNVFANIYASFYNEPEVYELKGIVIADFDGSLGDSGGTVYETTTGTPAFAGTFSAHNSGTGESAYIPYYRYTNEFSGLSWGFS